MGVREKRVGSEWKKIYLKDSLYMSTKESRHVQLGMLQSSISGHLTLLLSRTDTLCVEPTCL
jgi:hypothetical protein